MLGELEQFIHDTPHRTSPIVKAGLVHAQFETIHPFLDGNGRLGRLLITFLLCAQGALSGRLVELGIAREITGKSYARQYVYQRQLELLN